MRRAFPSRSTVAPLALVCLLACGSEPAPPRAEPESPPAKVVATPSEPELVTRPECLEYDTTVTLTGRLRRETHPGRPNFESVANGDAPEAGFYLILDSPVCTNGYVEEADRLTVDSTSRVQLVLTGKGELARFRPSLGKRISLTGTLFSAHTGHHHAPLLLQGVEMLGSTAH